MRCAVLEQYLEFDEKCPRIYGSFRAVRYANFLVNEYFPLHDDLCHEEGRLMLSYVNGTEGAGEALAMLSGRTRRLIDKYWGRD